jgi:hypothetical protein
MDKGFKYTLGERINAVCVELLLSIYRINTAHDKTSFFAHAREQVEYVRLLLRMTKDLKLVTTGNFASLNDLVENISKQMTGWQRAFKDNHKGGHGSSSHLFSS